jgi:hypothetical protein
MISRNLSRRLKRLEARAMPDGEPMVIEVQFVSPDKVVTGSPAFQNVESGPIFLIVANSRSPYTPASAVTYQYNSENRFWHRLRSVRLSRPMP